ERLLPAHRADGDGALSHQQAQLFATQRAEVHRAAEVDLIRGIVLSACDPDVEIGGVGGRDRVLDPLFRRDASGDEGGAGRREPHRQITDSVGKHLAYLDTGRAQRGGTGTVCSFTPGSSDPSVQYSVTSWPRAARPAARSQMNACAPPSCAGRSGVTGEATTAILTTAA